MAKKCSRLTKALLEIAKDMQESGIINEAAYEKITLRHSDRKKHFKLEPITKEEIRMRNENQIMDSLSCNAVRLQLKP